MTRFSLLCCFAFGIHALLGAQYDSTPSFAARVGTYADTLLTEAIRAEDFVGVSAGIYYQEAVLWQGGAGYRNLANQTAATPEMLHRIASISKPMTAVAVLQLAATGLLDLDAPIQRYLPQFPAKAAGPITIRQLLNHTSGIPAYRSAREFTSRVHYPTLWEATAVFRDRKLLFEPGTEFSYTTYGYTILGAIIERVTDAAYAEYMREHVWGPAGMLHTDVELTGRDYPLKSKLYRKDKRGDFEKDVHDILSIKYAGGGIQSTVADLLAFGRAILDNELLTAEQLAAMRQVPAVPRQGTPYGLGWYVVDDPEHGRIVRHGGAQSGTSTYLEIYLDQRLVVAVLANTAGADLEVGALKDQLARLVLDPDRLDRPIPRIASLAPEQLDRLTGTYELETGRIVKIFRRGNRLWSRVKGFPDLRLFPASESELFIRAIDGGYRFEWRADGPPVVTYQENGTVLNVRKVK